MEILFDDTFLNKITDKILRCATPVLYGEDVRLSAQCAINDVRRSLTEVGAGDPNVNQRVCKNSLANLANGIHPSMPAYKNILQYAVSLIQKQNTH